MSFWPNLVPKQSILNVYIEMNFALLKWGGAGFSTALSAQALFDIAACAQTLFDIAAQRSDPLLPLSAPLFLTLALSAPT